MLFSFTFLPFLFLSLNKNFFPYFSYWKLVVFIYQYVLIIISFKYTHKKRLTTRGARLYTISMLQ